MEKQINLLNLEGNVVKTVAFPEQFLIEEPNKQTIFDCVIAENAAERQGTHSTLTKGEVRGGGKKPWRQKHTGRARTGSTRNPQWVGGGVVFGPKPNRNYTKKVNSKVFQIALRSALTMKVEQSKIYAIENIASMEQPSTKTIANLLKTASLANEKILFIAEEMSNFAKSTNNLPKVTTKKWGTVSVRDLVDANIVIFESDLLNREGMNL